ncbi:NLRC3, partial [Symbiodinium necroappetens]
MVTCLEDTPEATYDLRVKEDLAKFLQDANIRLVRAECSIPLVACDDLWMAPLEVLGSKVQLRCMDMELTCDVRGEEAPALVTHAELSEWAAGRKDALICSVSHAWETREHPDPCRFQLRQLVNCVSLYDAAYHDDVWVFYDYVSLFQFERQREEEERSFRLAMQNMQVLYAHEYSFTFRIESLTPDAVWQAALQDSSFKVPVFHEVSGAVQQLPLKDLVENRVPYADRGWCRGEVQWSCARNRTAQHQRIDPGDHLGTDELKGRVPMSPAVFEQLMADARFTHRSDKEAVSQLQAKIFHDKVSACDEAVLENLPAEEVRPLAESLKFYKRLRALKLIKVFIGKEEAKALGEALASLKTLEDIHIELAEGSDGSAVAEALAEALKRNSSLTTIDLSFSAIGDAGAKALTEALKQNSSLTTIDLSENFIIDGGTKAAVLSRPSLAFMWPACSAHQALAEDLKQNSSLTTIDLSDNFIVALAEALKQNSSLTTIQLRATGIGDDGAK